MTQQTALEWFLEAIGYKQESDRTTIINIHPDCDITDLIKQAKQMEKEQMKGMYVEGGFAQMRYFDGKEFITGEQYYNEKYNK